MSFEDDVKAGKVSKEGWSDVAWFVRDGKAEKVQGWLKIQTLSREDDAYPNQYHGTKEAAEEYIEMTYHPVEHAHKAFKAGEISLLELQGRVGVRITQQLIDEELVDG